MSDNEKAVKELNNLLEKNYDASNGYKKAMEDVDDPSLRNYFEHRSAQRSAFATELDNRIRSCGGTPKESGSATGALHRTWMDVRSGLAGDNKEEAILKECIRGDKASAEEYRDAMEKDYIDADTRALIQQEKANVEQSLSEIRSMEDVREHYTEPRI
jgi:uncharacterized protein (TIGR02284 family)